MEPQRIQGVDCAKGIAILMVIYIHAADSVYSAVPMSVFWWTVMACECLSRICVPLFIMISGYLLLGTGKAISPLAFYERMLPRIGVPFMTWTLIYFIWKHSGTATGPSFRTMVSEIAGGPVYYHLWYLYLMLGVYLATPFLDRIFNTLNQTEFVLFLGLWYFFATLVPWLEWFGKFSLPVPSSIFGSYFGFFMFGGWSRRITLQGRQPMVLVIVCTGIVALTIVATGLMSWRDGGQINRVFFAFLSPNIALLSMLMWLLLKDARWRFKTIAGSLVFLGKLSLGIYVSHILILELVGRFMSRWTDSAALGLVGSVFLTTGIAVAFTWLCRKIPIVRLAVT